MANIGTTFQKFLFSYEDSLSGQQKQHYQKYLDGIRAELLETLPSIGVYKGTWTSEVLTKKDIENIIGMSLTGSKDRSTMYYAKE